VVVMLCTAVFITLFLDMVYMCALVLIYAVLIGSCDSLSKTTQMQFQWLLLELDCMEELYKMHTKVN